MKPENRTFEEKLKVTIRTEVGKGPAGGESPKDTRPEEAKIKEAHAKVAQFQAALRMHEEEIMQWLAADSSRIAALKENPKATMKMLAAHLGISIPDLAGIVADDKTEINFDISVSTNDPPFGSELLQKVWTYISENEQQTTAFRKNPEAVVREVATRHNTGAEETEAVVKAVLITSGKQSQTNLPPSVFQSLDLALARATLSQGPKLNLKIRR